MDPGTVVVGFAASLATLVVMAGNSSKSLNTLWRNIKDSPKQLQELRTTVEETETLLKEMQDVGRRLHDIGNEQGLLALWEHTRIRVLREFQELDIRVRKILDCGKGPPNTKMHIRRRAKLYLTEQTLEKISQRLKERKVDLHNIHTYICRYVVHLTFCSYTYLTSISSNSELRGQTIGAKLDAFVPQIMSRQDDILNAVVSGFNNTHNQELIRHGFGTDAFQLCQAKETVGGDAEKLLRYYPGTEIETPLLPKGTSDCGATSSPMQWNSYKYYLPVGTMWMEQESKGHIQSSDSPESRSHAGGVNPRGFKNTKVMFSPRPWLSNHAVRIEIAARLVENDYKTSFLCSFGSSAHSPAVQQTGLIEINELPPNSRLLAIGKLSHFSKAFEVSSNRQPPKFCVLTKRLSKRCTLACDIRGNIQDQYRTSLMSGRLFMVFSVGTYRSQMGN